MDKKPQWKTIFLSEFSFIKTISRGLSNVVVFKKKNLKINRD